jgi:polygalacturonase
VGVAAPYAWSLMLQGIPERKPILGTENDALRPSFIQPINCRNVIIEDCCFDTGDDCIVLKAGLNEDGWRVDKPCENIIIRHCRTKRGHGGVVIGSEMSGSVRNIFIHDCKFNGTGLCLA